MANPEHLAILKQGVEVWNRWRVGNPGILPNLKFADVSGMMLSGANLYKADLWKAKLSRAVLSEANLRKANLSQADLTDADLNGSNLSVANLTLATLHKAKLRKAYLGEADLSKSDLNGADLSEATVVETKFGNTDLQGVTGLETLKHVGPSYIDVHTIYLSKGKIPEVFLKGAGVPDTFIAYVATLAANIIHYYSCFISYSSKDEAFSQKLHTDLQQKGVRCWFAPEDMKIGDKIRPAIDQSIRIHDKLLIILSHNSISSQWVESEVEKAFEEEQRRGQTVLFPVRLDETVMETDKAWATEIRRTRHIGNFTRWKDHDAYQVAFERLLRDLKAEG